MCEGVPTRAAVTRTLPGVISVIFAKVPSPKEWEAAVAAVVAADAAVVAVVAAAASEAEAVTEAAEVVTEEATGEAEVASEEATGEAAVAEAAVVDPCEEAEG